MREILNVLIFTLYVVGLCSLSQLICKSVLRQHILQWNTFLTSTFNVAEHDDIGLYAAPNIVPLHLVQLLGSLFSSHQHYSYV